MVNTWTLRGTRCFPPSLAGCAFHPFEKEELPIAPDGVDKMRRSPCACTEIPYQAPTFEWVETA